MKKTLCLNFELNPSGWRVTGFRPMGNVGWIIGLGPLTVVYARSETDTCPGYSLEFLITHWTPINE